MKWTGQILQGFLQGFSFLHGKQFNYIFNLALFSKPFNFSSWNAVVLMGLMTGSHLQMLLQRHLPIHLQMQLPSLKAVVPQTSQIPSALKPRPMFTLLDASKSLKPLSRISWWLLEQLVLPLHLSKLLASSLPPSWHVRLEDSMKWCKKEEIMNIGLLIVITFFCKTAAYDVQFHNAIFYLITFIWKWGWISFCNFFTFDIGKVI